ncbi:metal-sulfur cluster assembly factor [Chryseobacterium sp. A301]
MSSQTTLPKDERAMNALYDVIDPELNVNIVDLGLVYDITFAPNTVHVLMTLTSRFCPMGDAIKTGVVNALEAEFPGEEIEIELTFEPAWNFEFVSDQGREELNNR